ncbi:MAG TPA: VOC family protein [Bauldia sp.]|nr:VOC family protein [Bauldia sp.]
MNRVVHFEIHAGDPKRVIAFYGSVFGWQFQPYGPPDFYWLITTGDKSQPGINGGLLKRMGKTPDINDPTPVIAYVCTVEVADFDKTAAAILTAGGTQALPKNAIPGVGWQAYFKDTDGNIFGIHQPDTSAK